MNAARQQTAGRRGERGYALLLIVFLATLLLLSTMVVTPNILTEGRREKEKEMIWRGKQYTRGIKLYYRKMGHFPTSFDDLTKPKIGSLRFMRQAYKDPMNKEDGSWRLIYVRSRPVDWKPETSPKSPASASWRDGHGRKCFERIRNADASEYNWSGRWN